MNNKIKENTIKISQLEDRESLVKYLNSMSTDTVYLDIYGGIKMKSIFDYFLLHEAICKLKCRVVASVVGYWEGIEFFPIIGADKIKAQKGFFIRMMSCREQLSRGELLQEEIIKAIPVWDNLILEKYDDRCKLEKEASLSFMRSRRTIDAIEAFDLGLVDSLHRSI